MNIITAIPIAIMALLVITSARAETSTLRTRTGGDIGLSLSSYQYQEPGIMSLKGSQLGLDLGISRAMQGERFMRGEFRYAYGRVDYSSNGTGSSSGEPNWYIEARGLMGKDWEINGKVLAAYTGIGYRYLFNDARGTSSTGHWGYRRESNYFYLPIGLILRTSLSGRARLVSTLEYDHLLWGKQISRLSDAGAGYDDVTNGQGSGYGLKLSVMYESGKFAFGPYAHYWDIGESDMAFINSNGTPVGIGWEPKNNTTEFGLKITQQF